MPGLIAHDRHHGFHRFHLVHPYRARTAPLSRAVRETRAVTSLVAIATATVGALWVCAAVGLADISWWRTVVVLAAIAFAGLALATLAWLRR